MSTRGRYPTSLGRLPWFVGLGRRDLRTIARLVDDIVVPAGFRIGRSDRQVLLVVEGTVETGAGPLRGPGAIITDAALRTCTPARLLVVHRNAAATLSGLAPAFDTAVTSLTSITSVTSVTSVTSDAIDSAPGAATGPTPGGPARLSA